MCIFEKRPLCMILCIMLGSFSLFTTLALNIKIITGITLLIFAFISLRACRNLRKYIITVSLFSILLTLIGNIVFERSFYPVSHYGKDVEFTGYISERYDTSYGMKAIIEVRSIDNSSCNYRILAESDDFFITDDDLYREIKLMGKLEKIDSRNDVENVSYLLADGISAYLTDISDLEISDNKATENPFDRIRNAVSRRFHKTTNEHTGSLLDALILGERDGLSNDISMDFRRIGISHILALSGMHLSILTGAVSTLLSIIGIGKIKKIIINSCFVLLYMALTGFSASVTRAGLMLLIMNLLFLLRTEADSFTTLSLAVSIIILFSPSSIYDIGLWLSAIATLGILVYNEFLDYEKENSGKRYFKIAKRLISPFLMSVFAIGLTYFITVPSFKEISLLSLVSTVIFSPLVEFFVYIGIFTAIFGTVLPIGKFVAFIGDIVTDLASILSCNRWASVSTSFIAVKISCIALGVSLLLFLVLKIKRKRLYIGLVILLFIINVSLGLFSSYTNLTRDRIIYSADKADSILLISDKEVSLIYSGEAATKNIDTASKLIYDERIRYIDNLIFTDIDGMIDSKAYRIIKEHKTDKVLLPIPHGEKEIAYAKNLAKMLSEFSTDLSFYSENEAIRNGDMTYTLNARTITSDNIKTSSAVYSVKTDERSLIFASNEFDEYCMSEFKEAVINAHTLVLTSRGTEGKMTDFNLKIEKIEKILYTKSHIPSDNVTEYYKEKGVPVTLAETPINLIR